MKPIDVLTSPWAIVPEKLTEITSIYNTHLKGEKIDIAALEAKIGQPLKREEQGYQVENGVALIPIDGVIAKKMNLFSRISGGASTELIARDVRAAVADPGVNGIILLVDSPGGSVDGTQALASVIREAAREKPIIAWADGMMASAAYWIGSAADRVYAAGDTTFVGSIGVVTQHVDVSGYEQKAGIKTTEIYAGKYKRIASEYAPLSKAGKEYMQGMVDHLYSVFVADVAKHRGVSEDTVIENMAEGRIFIGQQAVGAGLVDGVSTLDALIAELAAGQYRPRRSATGAAGAAAPAAIATATPRAEETPAPAAGEPPASVTPAPEATPPTPKGPILMNKEALQKDHPDLFAALRAEFSAEGAAAERARIQDVEAQALPGTEKLIAGLKYDGKTTGPEAAVQVLAHQRQVLQGRAAALEEDANALPKVTPSADADAAAAAQAVADKNAPVEERAKKTWDTDANIRGEFGTLGAYTGYLRGIESGTVKVLGKRAA